MKELTIVLNLQLTSIMEIEDEEESVAIPALETALKRWMEKLKESTDADDLLLLDRKVFIRDMEGNDV